MFGLTACGSGGGASLSSIHGYTVVPGDPLAAPTQSVVQDDGQSWSYAKPAPGKVTLLYFGYTSCPDVCPITMADLSAALSQLPANVADKVWVQFVSTDPERDTAEKLSAWIGQINPRFHAARAPIDSVIAAGRAYGIAIEKPVVSKEDYHVTHGGQLLVLDQSGGAVGYFHELAATSTYQEAIPTLVKRYS